MGEVLRRNDEDPHAAGEMLAGYKQHVQRCVAESSAGKLAAGEEVYIAETALDSTDWDPGVAFVTAENLARAVLRTRRLIADAEGPEHLVSIEHVLPALTASQLRPKVAAEYLLGASGHDRHQDPRRDPSRKDFAKPHRQEGAAEEDDTCGIM